MLWGSRTGVDQRAAAGPVVDVPHLCRPIAALKR